MEKLINNENETITVDDATYIAAAKAYAEDPSLCAVLLHDIHDKPHCVPMDINNMMNSKAMRALKVN